MTGGPTSGRGVWRRVVAAVALACASVLASAGPASAHASLLSSDPPADAHLTTAPRAVTLTFSEEIDVIAGGITLRGGDGVAIPVSSVVADGHLLRIALPGLGDDAYALGWRVLSADMHPVAGTLVFTVGAAERRATLSSGATGADAIVRVAGLLARAAVFGALLVGCGLVLVRAAARLDATTWRPFGRPVLLVVLAATVTGLAAQAADVRDGQAGSMVSGDAWRAVLDTRFGRLWVLRAVLVVVLACLVPAARADGEARTRRVAAVALVLAILATVAGSGHASAGRAPALAWIADVAHLVVAATWVGGLLVVVAAARGPRDRFHPTVARVSRLAGISVALLVVTGVAQAWRQRALDADALVDTSYGRLLLVKVGLVAVVLALASGARRRVRRGPLVDPTALRRVVLAELAGLAVVVGVTGALVHASPPAPAAAASLVPAVHVAQASEAGVTVELRVSPPAPGPVTVDARVIEGGPVEEITIVATPPAGRGDVAPFPLPVHDMGAGEVMASDVTLPLAGDWEIVVTVRTGPFDEVVLRFRVAIGSS